ncbi:uncharacterized protein F4822DRAFT_430282 [Hypoxylon trugodes]|uniref:uncharacterized protein n=1 Tax=Hypoxylon trugodes TaxID=326681 RepID=UPI00218F0034|nr:uncharacterized protein F4822DRAFT_430282 [Hypoxylon trugodes]KAI1387535.1 hypothetical protein F4822DRAFT_430282 [Hypoxylon trugodes]
MRPDANPTSSSEAVGLLETPEHSDIDEKDLRPHPQQRKTFVRYGPWFILIGLLVVSLIANAIQLWTWLQARAAANVCKSPLCTYPSPTAGLSPSKLVQFGQPTPWSNATNMTALDELWYGMDVNAGVIQLPKDAHFGTTQDFPWDTSRGLYMLNSYHSLHCLKIIYSYVRDWEEGRSRVQTIDHVAHCLEVVRMDIMCVADDTLLSYPVDDPEELPPKRMCRDWDQLEEFAISNSACFERRELDDPFRDSLIEYMNCPTSSPYYEVVEELRKNSSAANGKEDGALGS